MKMIIDGQMSGSESGKAFEIVNPATGRVIDTVPQATERDIERAGMGKGAGMEERRNSVQVFGYCGAEQGRTGPDALQRKREADC